MNPTSDISIQDVRRTAALARLRPSELDLSGYQADLAAILAYVRGLGTLDLDGVAPMAHPSDSFGVPADDEPGPMLDRQALAALCPRMDGPFIHVPKVIGDGGGG